ncbi:MAG: HIG1 domain-containing protein [Pseudomonadota bacterium]
MDLLTALVLSAALATAITLFNGINSMAHGGEADAHASHRLMFQRVGWQALTVFFLLLALLTNLR